MARSVPSHINISSNVFSSVPSCHPQFHQVLWARQFGGDEKWMNQLMNMWISTLTKNFEMSRIHLTWFGLHGGDDGGVILMFRGLKKLVWCSVRWWWVVEVEVEVRRWWWVVEVEVRMSFIMMHRKHMSSSVPVHVTRHTILSNTSNHHFDLE